MGKAGNDAAALVFAFALIVVFAVFGFLAANSFTFQILSEASYVAIIGVTVFAVGTFYFVLKRQLSKL